MATYVTLVKFTSEGLKNIGDFGKEWERARDYHSCKAKWQ